MARSRMLAVLGWGGLAALAVGVAVQLTLTPHMAGNEPGEAGLPEGTIRLTKQEQRIEVPAHKTYGIWADDQNNTGYAMSGDCSIVDDRGRPVKLNLFEGPAVEFHFGSDFGSGSAEFVYEFNTGSGKLTVLKCKGSGADFSVRPLTHASGSSFTWMMAPLLIGVQLSYLGVGMLVAWLVVRLLREATPPSA